MIKVSELKGVELDYWVADCLGLTIHDSGTSGQFVLVDRDGEWEPFAPSVNWSNCGPLLEGTRLGVGPLYNKSRQLVGGYGSGAPGTKPLFWRYPVGGNLQGVCSQCKGRGV